MRVTNNMVTRNYTKSLSENYSRLNKYSSQVMSGQKFSKMSEDTSSGVRAMQVRRGLSRLEGYQSNTQGAINLFASAEKTMMQATEISHSVSEKFIQAMNGTYDDEQRNMAFATELEKLRDEMISTANGQFADRFMFGGTNTGSAPFAFDTASGVLTYNGQDVSTLTGSEAIFNDSSFIDIGLGVNFEGTANSQTVNPNSAFKNTFSGLDFLGYGSENSILLVNDMVNMLKGGSMDSAEAGKLLDRFKDSANNITLNITKLGSDTKYLDFTLDRLKSEETNLIERQKTIEIVDPETAIMNFKVQEYVYNAALQMGQRLLQPTLFSFIN